MNIFVSGVVDSIYVSVEGTQINVSCNHLINNGQDDIWSNRKLKADKDGKWQTEFLSHECGVNDPVYFSAANKYTSGPNYIVTCVCFGDHVVINKTLSILQQYQIPRVPEFSIGVMWLLVLFSLCLFFKFLRVV